MMNGYGEIAKILVSDTGMGWIQLQMYWICEKKYSFFWLLVRPGHGEDIVWVRLRHEERKKKNFDTWQAPTVDLLSLPLTTTLPVGGCCLVANHTLYIFFFFLSLCRPTLLLCLPFLLFSSLFFFLFCSQDFFCLLDLVF